MSGNAASRQVPEPYSSIVNRVCKADREYFERHPAKREYLRPMVQGEFWPALVQPGAWVRVVKLGSGVRTRELLA
jgi:hypothetical protein